ncbi:MAG TPA: serine/threonine-protein kinase [Polyangium sp.]|nr:serine/threonine-protein kinase [Polyangium sp.]
MDNSRTSSVRPGHADASTDRFDIVFAPTLPAPSSTTPVVQSDPGTNAPPAAIHERFHDIRVLGSGGMGIVYRARDTRLGRDVAIKLLKSRDALSWSRFRAEAQAQARVEHDNICRVYDVGEVDGEPFIVMQLIDGEPLSVVKKNMDLRQRVEVVQKIATAVHAAHANGLVHRDLKPGNILVEARKDGSFRPYVVDFGLAREVNGGPGNMLRVGLGTPGYVAPEVLLRGSESMFNPSVDVYGLGATLYSILAGRPPQLVEERSHVVDQDDPPPLRELAKDVPAELGAMVMKCLDREPERRYASAGALAEDLQRFLDAARRDARPIGWLPVLRQKVVDHAGVGTVAIVMLSIAATFVGVRVREQRKATQQAELAQNMGRSVTEMEMYMRTAYQMPPHDIERDRAVIRERIRVLEEPLAEAGPRAAGPSQYALGRAYLALGDNERACEHLERAEASGYSTPALGYALGLAQLGMYDLHLHQAEWYEPDADRRHAKVEAAKARYVEPAIRRLRAAVPAPIEHPAYAAALVAKEERHFEEAAVKAREAFAKAPLLYEAKLVEGEALMNIASSHWGKGQPGWWKEMKTGMLASLDAYSAAENIARSDPRVLQAICGARSRLMYVASRQGEPLRPYFESAREVCDKLVQVDPSSPSSRATRACMYSDHVYALVRMDAPDEDPLPRIEEARRITEDALARSEGALIVGNALGAVLRAQAVVLLNMGRDATEALDMAEHHFDVAMKNVRGDSMRDGRAYLYNLRAMDERSRGVDMSSTVERANRVLDEQIAANTLVMMAHDKRVQLLGELAQQQIDMGKAPTQAIEGMFDATAKAKAVYPAYSLNSLVRAMGFLLMARYALLSKTSPRDALEHANTELQTARAQEPDAAYTLRYSGLLAVLTAEEIMQKGGDPTELLKQARDAYRRVIEKSPTSVEIAVAAAEVELVAARYAVFRGHATQATFEAVRAPLQSWLSDKLVDPAPYAMLAESSALAAAWRLSRAESAESEVKEGLAMAARALARNPRHAMALAARGRLLLIRARGEKNGPARREAANDAIKAFEASFQANPLIERHHGHLLGEGRRLQ